MSAGTVVRLLLAAVITAVWGTSYAVSIVNHSYHPPPEINAAMLLAAGYFFATGIRQEGEAKAQAAEQEREQMREMIDAEIARRQRLVGDARADEG